MSIDLKLFLARITAKRGSEKLFQFANEADQLARKLNDRVIQGKLVTLRAFLLQAAAVLDSEHNPDTHIEWERRIEAVKDCLFIDDPVDLSKLAMFLN